MKILYTLPLVAALAGAPAFAQTTPPQPATPDTGSAPRAAPPEQSTGNPALKNWNPNSAQPGAGTGLGTGTEGRSAPASVTLEQGANSFTEAQARSQIESAGFNNITGLVKDDQGIWRGKAQRNGQTVSVGLDYKGNVASQPAQ